MAIRPRFKSELELTDSSVISKVRYDRKTCILDVKLRSGQAYRYQSVWGRTFVELVTEQSSGKVYNEDIKRDYFGALRKATKIRSW